MKKYKVLIVGCGNMGTSHARAYHKLEQFEIAGLVSRTEESRRKLNNELGGKIMEYSSFEEGLKNATPDVVCISTYPETHAEYAIKSLEAGAHVFVEKPLANTVEESIAVVEAAKKSDKKLVIGYILRVHPAWKKFTEIAKTLGTPLVMRMNLNQQSSGANWKTHKSLMNTMSPIVDCGVHYIDVMCQMTSSKPIQVSAIGAKLTDEIDEKMYNYGQLQVTFDNGSVGWYEAGWGPMISETAFFVKDVIGPNGCVSIIDSELKDNSQDIEGHTKTGSLKLHHSLLDKQGNFAKKDEIIDTSEEPDHDGLCQLEQEFLLDAIINDRDLTEHQEAAVQSLQVVLAADQAFKTGKTIKI